MGRGVGGPPAILHEAPEEGQSRDLRGFQGPGVIATRIYSLWGRKGPLSH